MERFVKVNSEGKTIWLNVGNVLWVEEPDDPNLMSTVVRLVGGTLLELDEDYEELLETLGITVPKL